MLRRLFRLLAATFASVLLLAALGAAGAVWVFHEYGKDLPDYRQLADYEPPTTTRIHAGDGRLLAEYARERRLYVPIEAIPERLIQAFLVAEDKSFYSHPGIDIQGIARAALQNIERLRDDRRPRGGSTITQQVAKNFLLSGEVSIERKIREMILAFRIERAFTKDQILELYLNEIYLGAGAYGVAAAALNYFNKSLDELTTTEMAFLAGVPQAPSYYHPVRNHDVAKARRDWVISRLLEEGFIDEDAARASAAEPLEVRRREAAEHVIADYFTEEVRRQLVGRYGEDGFYEGGLSVRTTLEPGLQATAERSLIDGLARFDRERGGYRGPLTHLELGDGSDWQARLARHDIGFDPRHWNKAIVLGFEGAGARIGFEDGEEGVLAAAGLRWARPVGEGGRLGAAPERAEQILRRGDVVLVEPEGEGFALRQIPEVQGAIVALDPHTGRVLAMHGGFSQRLNQFNRATQALRQPGSAFKPFVYLAGLEAGYTPSTVILDEQVEYVQGPGLPLWRPTNYSNEFYGPTSFRAALEKSRNIPTIRIAHEIGMERVYAVAERLGIERGLGLNLASVLGTSEVTLLDLTAAYAAFVNGGREIRPGLIERIQDRHGRTILRRDERPCPECRQIAYDGLPPPALPDDRAQVVDPRHAYQIVSMLEGVVERGTATAARAIGKPLAGKTGTTNDHRDAWFIGFTPDLAVGVFIGHDQPRPLGPRATGGSVALPVFVDFMQAALEEVPAVPFRVPSGVRLVRVDAESGRLPGAGTRVAILEAYLPGTEPTSSETISGRVIGDAAGNPALDALIPRVETGGSGAPTGGGIY
jgi:penicillin-binding protein 1A